MQRLEIAISVNDTLAIVSSGSPELVLAELRDFFRSGSWSGPDPDPEREILMGRAE
jgi:hypothetical protein